MHREITKGLETLKRSVVSIPRLLTQGCLSKVITPAPGFEPGRDVTSQQISNLPRSTRLRHAGINYGDLIVDEQISDFLIQLTLEKVVKGLKTFDTNR